VTTADSGGRFALHWQILIAIAVAVVVGRLVGTDAAIFGVKFLAIFEFIGVLFLNALKMLIVPLIVSSMIVGISGLTGQGEIGRLGRSTLFFYGATGICAVVTALLIVNVVAPGIVEGKPAKDVMALTTDAAAVEEKISGRGAGDVIGILERALPPNVFQAASDNAEMLGVIVFSLLFGYFLTRIARDEATPVINFWKGVFSVMMRMTELVMRFAPIGVFALVAQVAAKTGFAAAVPLLIFAGCVLTGLVLHAFVTLPIFLAVFGGVKPYAIFPKVFPAMLTAFSTASSSATLPVNMECVEKGAGVSNRITSFVLPLGATVNMNGTALYECAAVLFISQAYGVDLSLAQQLLIVLLALVTSVGVAGIPAASLVAIAVILQAVGLPPESLALLFVFDRPLDMARTAVNVFGDAVTAVIIARREGEKNVLAG
jgi:proton glutamate symport protein